MLTTLAVYVDDAPGVLNRVASLFRRRVFNIVSLTVGHSHHAGESRMTVVVDYPEVLEAVARSSLKTKEAEALFVALGWRALEDLGPRHRTQRLSLLSWAGSVLADLPSGSIKERLHQLALKFPMELVNRGSNSMVRAR